MKRLAKAIEDYGAGISLCLFLACLAFPAFYVGVDQAPSGSLSLLATGWMGFFYGQFSWLANPAYVAAFIARRAEPPFSLSLAIVALLLALSFLFNRTIVVNEGGLSDVITGVGWGYFLWVTAMLVLVLAQSHVVWRNPPRILPVVAVVLVGVAVVAFGVHYYLGDTGHWRLARERSTYLASHCGEAMEKIHEYPTSLRGLYLAPDGEEEFRTSVDGRVHGWSQSTLAYPGLIAGRVTMVEASNDNSRAHPYRRIMPGKFPGVEVDSLDSDYRVETTSLLTEQRPGLSISHKHIEVRAMDDNRLIAEATYVVDFASRQACLPDPGRGFSTRALLGRTFARVGPGLPGKGAPLKEPRAVP